MPICCLYVLLERDEGAEEEEEEEERAGTHISTVILFRGSNTSRYSTLSRDSPLGVSSASLKDGVNFR